MSQRTVLEYPDPRLRLTAAPVEAFDSALADLVDDLFDTLYATSGIALAAPQTGALLQVLVCDLSSDRSAPQVYINPEILASAVPALVEESCLSVPGVVGNVIRATRVSVRARDRAGKVIERDLEGMDAVCLQHEMDHLAGKLFVDRLSLLGRLKFRATAALKARRGAA